MKIKAKWGISYSSDFVTFDLSEMNCQSEDEWNALTESQKEQRIQEAIDEFCDAPSMMLDSYNIES